MHYLSITLLLYVKLRRGAKCAGLLLTKVLINLILLVIKGMPLLLFMTRCAHSIKQFLAQFHRRSEHN